jgi:hypothetical protein
MNKIGIILTTIERDKAFFMALKSILDTMQENWMVIAGYQAEDKVIEFSHPQIYTYPLPYNCGISYARNDMILQAQACGCDYILLTADSILFNESIKYLYNILPILSENEYDLIGLNLLNRISWEAKLKLLSNDSFELDFIDKNSRICEWLVGDEIFNIWPCDIVRNFWIAKTKSLIKVPYDNNLIMCEHEDFFYRYKQAGYKVGCTNLCEGLYNKVQNTPKYDELRQQNFRIGQQRLKDKYSLKTWVTYKNLERIKNDSTL